MEVFKPRVTRQEAGNKFLGFIYNPAVTEEVKPEPIPEPTPVKPTKILNVGDIVTFTGTTHYISANSTSPKSCKSGLATVTQVYKLGSSKHPYHLVRVKGCGSTVYGWVDESDIAEVQNKPAYIPKVGDTVIYESNVHYVSANSTKAKSCKGGLATITSIYKPESSKHPYHLVRVTDRGATVWGWVDKNSFTKL